MGVVSTPNASSLKMRFDCGKDNNGKLIIKNRTYAKVRPEATHEKVHQVAAAIASLQGHTLLEVAKIDNTTISQ